MLLFFLCAIIALIFAAVGFLVWLLLLVLKIRRKGWRIFKGTALSLAFFLPVFVFLISPLILSHQVANSSTRPQDQVLTHTPATYERPFCEVRFASRDGLPLQGWFMDGERTKPAFILCHGLFRNRQEVLRRACALNQQGFSTLLFDFRSHGKSERGFVSLGFQERLDVLGAYDFLKKEQNKKRFVLLGVSMGAVAVLHAAPDFQSDIEAIVADSAFLNLDKTVSHHANLFLGLPPFPFAKLFIWNLTRVGGYSESDLDSLEALGKMRNVPILLIYGRDDRRIPSAEARAIFEAIPHDRKEVLFFGGATHGAAYRSDPERYLEVIGEFLDPPVSDFGSAPLAPDDSLR